MTIEELKQTGALYFPHIREGLSSYSHEILVMDEAEACERLLEEWKARNRSNTWVDFYYYELEEEARAGIDNLLTDEERAYVGRLPNCSGEIIYEPEEALLRIIVKLNASEFLFSTIYFVDEPMTWWGNYNKEYIVFRRR